MGLLYCLQLHRKNGKRQEGQLFPTSLPGCPVSAPFLPESSVQPPPFVSPHQWGKHSNRCPLSSFKARNLLFPAGGILAWFPFPSHSQPLLLFFGRGAHITLFLFLYLSPSGLALSQTHLGGGDPLLGSCPFLILLSPPHSWSQFPLGGTPGPPNPCTHPVPCFPGSLAVYPFSAVG